jgi:CheY-like chemotaxis protein
MTTILLVEDNFDNLTLVRILLEREGYEVVTALDGKKGLKAAHDSKPDLIALDLDMPVIDGWEFLHQAKKDPEMRDIPIVIVTAHLLPGERSRVIEAGAVGYISKPFKVNEFGDEIRKFLGETT